MILLIDIGSTRFKWGFIKDKTFSFGGAFPHANEAISELFVTAWGSLTEVSQILIASVADKKIETAVTDWFEKMSWPPASFIKSSATLFGLTNAYHEPEQLGVDRWLGMMAGWQRHHRPVCVVSCGTFVTVDAVDAQGQHLGGLIIPGLKLMQSSLNAYGKNYPAPKSSLKDYPPLLAKDTYHAVTGGGVYALVAFIESITADVRHALGRHLHCILTGGDGATVMPLLKTPYHWEPDLVLRGLALLAISEEKEHGHLVS